MPDYPTPVVIFVSLLVGLVCLLRVFVAVRTGGITVRGPGFSAPLWTREEKPIGFWFHIVLMSVAAALAFATTLYAFGLAPDPFLAIEDTMGPLLSSMFAPRR